MEAIAEKNKKKKKKTSKVLESEINQVKEVDKIDGIKQENKRHESVADKLDDTGLSTLADLDKLQVKTDAVQEVTKLIKENDADNLSEKEENKSHESVADKLEDTDLSTLADLDKLQVKTDAVQEVTKLIKENDADNLSEKEENKSHESVADKLEDTDLSTLADLDKLQVKTDAVQELTKLIKENDADDLSEKCLLSLTDKENINISSDFKSTDELTSNLITTETNTTNVITKDVTKAQCFDEFLNINKAILKTINNIDSIPAQVNSRAELQEETINNIDSIPVQVNSRAELQDETSGGSHKELNVKPYTEQQLSALYYNSELDALEGFNSSYVEAELKCLPVKQHCLYDLLTNYLKVREKITGNQLELNQLRKEYNDLQKDLWTLENATVTGRAECQDGQLVTANHTYHKSVFHRAIFQNIVRLMMNIQKLVFEKHVQYSYSAEDLKLQIELYIYSIEMNVINVANLNLTGPVSLYVQSEPNHLKPYLSEIRLSISVLFAFQRKLIRDAQFLIETRDWLSQLVAVLLRVANYQDHLFLINHILRCPAGVGTWAASFVQVPLNISSEHSPFSNYEVNHLLAVLSVILGPIKDRDKFMKDLAQNQDTAAEAIWVLVDSDGEDDENGGVPLKENDLVALFNQLPLDDLFRCLLSIQKRDAQDYYDVNKCDENHLLRFLALSTVLLRLVYSGLQTYNQARYNQFSKRLSRFIRHIVQYATDQWEIFLMAKKFADQSMVKRLHCEYDAFFLRAIFALYSSQKLGAWQFLAVVPYNMVTIKTLWKIFYFLHICDKHSQNILNPMVQDNYDDKIWDQDFRDQFSERLETLEDAEIYYLLNTFANMALSRSNDDMNFILCATMDLLEVGFICKTTQDSCSKSARILLAHITSKHPHLLSSILKKVRDNMATIGSLALYLYEDIPLSIWMLTDDDMYIIAGLLMRYTINDVETKLARMILSRLNWNLLPYEKHCDTALLVVKVVDQEPGYLQWGWQTILRLKLHISDKHFKEWGQVPELEKFDVISKGVRDNNPLSSFVAVLMTSWGHLVPLICSKGLNEIINIQTHQKHEAALFALYQIVPLFINSQECIINCEKFQEILMNLISADRGYISYAKSFIMTQNTVLQQFGNMIETQIVNYAYYDLISPRLLVRLWMNSLVSIPHWNKDNGVLYLLDTIIRAAFFHQDSLEIVYENLRELYQCGTPQDSGSIISIFKWVSSGNNSVNSLLSNSLASYPWLAFVFLEIEHQEREIRSGLWKEILIQLSKQKGKINVDNAIKKAASIVKVTPFSSGWLCLYRWSQQSLDTPIHHPLLPLLWQKFFTLFLTRIPCTSTVDKACVGERFFDGIVNFTFLKRIKRRLQETVEFYRVKWEEESDDAGRKKLYSSCMKVFQAFLLWLEEPRLQESNILLQNLPAQYDSNLLSLIIEQNSNVPWYEFVDYQRIKEDQQMCIKLWKVANFREKTNVNQPLPNAGSSMESADPIERILRRLITYDNPKNPPSVTTKAPLVQQIDFSNKETMFKLLEPSFKILKQFAHNHVLKVSELKALDCSYQELIPQLYRSVLNKVKKKIPCKGKNQTVHCSGAAVVVLEMQEAKVNERIEHQIQTNRTAYESLLDKSLQSSAINLYVSSVTIQQCIRILQQQLKCNPSTAELGVELFYYILSLLNEETLSYLPTKILFSSCLEKLGQSHICGVENEMARLLKSILKETNLAIYLAPHFSPDNIGTSNMLLMYSTIIKEMNKRYDISFALLSKFEIKKWLTTKNPKLLERSQIIECIIKALSNIGFNPPIEALTLHGIYRKHLITVFEYEFPEHYGEVLMHLLKASNGHSESNLVCKTVWLDIINVLSQPVIVNLKGLLRDQLRQYAQYQKILSHQELLETADLLARHFTSERLQYGLYGLYPKCRHYIDIYALLLGMIGHGLIISSLNTHQGLLGDKLCEKIWPYLREMFAPWLIPYSMQHLKDNMATWIQQLADDRSVLLPWIPSDSVYAQKIINVFFECILFIINTLPAATNILSYLWQWYVTSFAHISVKDHILVVIHQSFIAFPWQNFWPTMVDLEFMLKVIDQYLPDCHSFLGHIFMSVPWVNWMNNFQLAPTHLKVRIYHCFLNLLVKLSNEPNMRKNYLDKLKALIVQAEQFEWGILEALAFQHIMDWFVMSSDSAIIFRNDPLDLDYRLLFFLKGVSGLNKSWVTLTANLEKKRLIFVKANIKLLSVYISRHRNLIGSRQRELHTVITDYLNNIETIVTTDDEMYNLLKELTCIVNISDISTLALNTFMQWIQNKPGNGMVIKNLLRCLGMCVTDFDSLADLCELTITCYFCNTVSQENFHEPSWFEVIELVHVDKTKSAELERVLSSRGAFLTLNVILLQRVKRKVDSEMLFLSCLDWMENIKISESAESKIPLLWFTMLKLALEICEKGEATAATLLFKFSDILMQLSEDKGSGKWGRGLLSAIGLSKQEAVSLNFRFICRALAGYILAQLPEMKGKPQIVRRTENASSRVGQPGGNTDCPKILLSLDFGQSQGKIKEAAQLALNMIQDPTNSLHNADMFLWSLLKQFYIKGYLRDVS